jgi:antirestriction protein ArdC
MLAGDVPSWRRPWRTLRDSGAATMPRNAITGHTYRGVNTCLLWARQDADMRYLTFRQAKAHNGHVRKGEHGTQVTFWQKRQFTAKGEGPDGADKVKSSLLLKVYTVFNVSQCEGLELPKQRSAPAPLAPPPVMAEVFEKLGARVEHGGDRAFFAPGPDMIGLPRPEAFTELDAYSATALHELTHWTGHGKRLAREFGKRFGDKAYAAEELVAEIGSAFLCAALGVNSALEHHVSYVANWQQLLREDSRAIITAASKAQQAADYLLAKLETAAEPANDGEADDDDMTAVVEAA